MEPRDLNAEKITNVGIGTGEYNKSPMGININSCHIGVVNVLTCDGMVRAIHSSVDEKTLKALLTIDGGETVELQDF